MMDESKLIHKLIDVLNYKGNYQRTLSGLGKRFEFVLERIHMNENISPNQLAKKYNLPPSTLTGQLDKLEREGLIERVYSKQDRRSITLKTTLKGKEIISKHEDSDKKFTDNFFGSLDESEREKFKELLQKLLLNIDVEQLFE